VNVNSDRRTFLQLLAAFGAVATVHANAQMPWPFKPIRLIVAYPTGGTADTVARLLGERIALALGQPVVVENRAGASGTLGVDAAAKAPADGCTFAFSAISPLTLNPHISKSPFDPLKDIAPVARVMYSPVYVVATPAFTGKTFEDVIAQARANPGMLRFATSGVASVGHLMLEQIKARARVDFTHIPYKGGAQMAHDAAGGHFDLLSSNPNPALTNFIAQGRLRVLAVGAPDRLASMPNVPTLAELGYPAANLTSLFGVYAAAGVPAEIVRRMHAEINRVLAAKDMQERLAKLDNVASPASIVQFRAQIEAEYAAIGKVIKEAGIRAE
jgi:tripartite-type tricarboxylate transporter receptor subunit TctC